MAKENTKLKYAFFFMFVILLYLSFLVLKPFLFTILSAAALAYVFYPLYDKIQKKTKMRRISSLIVTLLILLLITFPFVFVANTLTREAYSSYIVIKQRFNQGNLLNLDCDEPSLLCNFSYYLSQNSKLTEYLTTIVNKASSYIIASASNFVFSLPSRFLEFFVLIFILYYLFIDGKYLMDKMWSLLSIKSSHKTDIAKRIGSVTYGVIYGSILTAIIQGLLAGIAYFVIGVNSPVLWAIMTALVALLPFLGSSIIWFPMSLYLFINGILGSDTLLIGKGIGLFLFGFLIISTVDNLIRPKLIGDKAKVHPAIVLLGVFGGLAIFGFMGILLGPLILAILTTSIEIYKEGTE